MRSATPELMRLAADYVRANEPCSPSSLVKQLKRFGASTRAAQETFLFMVRDGYLRQSWNGKLTLRR